MTKKKSTATKTTAKKKETEAPKVDNNEQAPKESPKTLQEKKDKPIVLLIPYLKSEAAGEELKYALRTWEANYADNIEVVVVGDKEDWFSDEVKHIPHDVHLIDEDCGCDTPKKVRNPQADVAHKIFTAIAADAVNGHFILSNDDIFLLGRIGFEQINFLRANGELDSGVGTSGGTYRQNALRTAQELSKRGFPTVRYGTHTPVVLESGLLAEVIKEYRATEQGLLLTSAYFNHWHPNARGVVRVTGQRDCTILASVYRSNPDEKVLADAFEKRLFLNCNAKGWNAIKSIFERVYDKPSRFEK